MKSLFKGGGSQRKDSDGGSSSGGTKVTTVPVQAAPGSSSSSKALTPVTAGVGNGGNGGNGGGPRAASPVAISTNRLSVPGGASPTLSSPLLVGSPNKCTQFNSIQFFFLKIKSENFFFFFIINDYFNY
jgi:hypothetical protein